MDRADLITHKNRGVHLTDIDEVSRQIGSLSARVDEAMRQNTAIFVKMDNAHEAIIEQRGAIKLLGSQFLEHKLHGGTKFSQLDAIIKDVDAIKNRGKGLAVGLGLVGGGGGVAGFFAAIKAFAIGSGG